MAVGALVVVVGLAGAIVLGASGGDSSSGTDSAQRSARVTGQGAGQSAAASGKASGGSTVHGTATGKPGSTPVPVLTYHVIAPPPPGAPFPGLYVPAD